MVEAISRDDRLVGAQDRPADDVVIERIDVTA